MPRHWRAEKRREPRTPHARAHATQSERFPSARRRSIFASIVGPAPRAALSSVLEPGEKLPSTGGPDSRSTLRTQSVLWWMGVPNTAAALALISFGFVGEGWE